MTSKTELKEQIRVMQHHFDGGKISFRRRYADIDWTHTDNPSWQWVTDEFRSMPDQMFSEINWEEINLIWSFMATDEDGKTHLFAEIPTYESGDVCWKSPNKDKSRAEIFQSFKVGGCQWQMSLVCRLPDDEFCDAMDDAWIKSEAVDSSENRKREDRRQCVEEGNGDRRSILPRRLDEVDVEVAEKLVNEITESMEKVQDDPTPEVVDKIKIIGMGQPKTNDEILQDIRKRTADRKDREEVIVSESNFYDNKEGWKDF